MSYDENGASDEEPEGAFNWVNAENRKNKGVRASIETTSEWRWKFRDLGDLSVMLPPHKRKLKKANEIRLKRPDPMMLDGSSPYAEYLPTWFWQYDPQTKDFLKGPEAVIHGGPSYIDPDMLMSANFGPKTGLKNSARKPSAASSARPLNFY